MKTVGFNKEPRKTAGELSNQIRKDTTKYDALEVGHAITDNTEAQLRICIENHKTIIDENEFCIVIIIAKDPLLHNVMRRKFYAWPYLPKPRPNQTVFLYNKGLDKITKRLWSLPNDMMMAELHSLPHVNKRYHTMKEWTGAFYHGWRFVRANPSDPNSQGNFVNTTPTFFWEYIRQQHNITMPSEHEYFLAHMDELIKAGCQLPTADSAESFDFSKIAIENFVDTSDPVLA